MTFNATTRNTPVIHARVHRHRGNAFSKVTKFTGNGEEVGQVSDGISATIVERRWKLDAPEIAADARATHSESPSPVEDAFCVAG